MALLRLLALAAAIFPVALAAETRSRSYSAWPTHYYAQKQSARSNLSYVVEDPHAEFAEFVKMARRYGLNLAAHKRVGIGDNGSINVSATAFLKADAGQRLAREVRRRWEHPDSPPPPSSFLPPFQAPGYRPAETGELDDRITALESDLYTLQKRLDRMPRTKEIALAELCRLRAARERAVAAAQDFELLIHFTRTP